MKIQGCKGTRDFYPDDMAVRNWLADTWRQVSIRHGFEEYDGPIFEYLDLYTAKSGQGIVDELFHFTDRGGREMAIRPEITPTLARMVNARANTLARPIKWFSIPRLCRAERPQRGRLREFFQWNLDVLGTDDLLADAECILAAIDCLRAVSLTDADVVVKINDRRLTAAILRALAIPEAKHDPAYAVIDKATRMSADDLAKLWHDTIGGSVAFDQIAPLLALQSRDGLANSDWPVLGEPGVAEATDELNRLFGLLSDLGVGSFCEFDARIVRGLAYYTGPVYEAFDRGGEFRAILGGGRYDNLLAILGGPKMSGTGMGMGDAVLMELLRDKGRVPTLGRQTDLYLIDTDASLFPMVLKTAGQLRAAGYACDFSYKRQAVGKQFKAASARGARRCVVFGTETAERQVVNVKDMTTGSQIEISLSEWLQDPMQPVE